MASPRPDFNNRSVAHGNWGENVATDFLRLHGYEILERNSRPCRFDHRLEIDIVAYEISTDTLVFVEVKQHSARSGTQRRLRSVNRNKRKNLRVAFNTWRRANAWETGYRFDVIEIYGTPLTANPEIDHIQNIQLFTPQQKFVKWD